MGASSDHALLSPSGASRWMACTPSARLEQRFPDSSRDAAREGTLAHAICEIMLLYAIGGLKKSVYEISLRKTIASDLIEDPENEGALVQEFYCHAMHEYCEQYVTFVMEQFAMSKAIDAKALIAVEKRLDISRWAPESFGTGDAGIVSDRILKIIDLKYGKGVEVSAINNTQMKVYALGWLDEFRDMYDIDVIEMTIFQPRIDNYSTWSIIVVDLLKWAEEELKPKAVLAFAGEGEFVAGTHCQFCRAKTSCRALADYCNELAKYDFAEPELLTDAEISAIASKASIFKNWIGAIEEHMLNEAVKHGKKWPGYKLVEGRSNRVFADGRKVVKQLSALGYEDGDYYNIDLKGIGDIEKLLGGKKAFAKLLNHLVIKPKGKPTLVPETDTRSELNSAENVAKDFDDDYLLVYS